MPRHRKLGNKRKKKTGNGQTSMERMEDEDIRPVAPCPFGVDLILQLIFSHLEVGDLLRARLVAKKWTPLATEEVRGRKSVFPWIGRVSGVEEERKRYKKDIFVLDEGSALDFMDVMTPLIMPLIPVQQIALRLDLLSIQPATLLSLLSFIAPWVHTLRLVPFVPWDLYAEASLEGDGARKAMAWSAALHSFPSLDFPRLETLEIGVKDEYRKTFHQTLAILLVHLVAEDYWISRVGLKEAEKEASKVVFQALPSSLKRLDLERTSYCCEVDYGTLTALGLTLEEFLDDSKPEPGVFLQFLVEQRMGLKRLYLLYLEDIYDPSYFPKFPLVTELKMIPKPRSTFECLKAFPNIRTLRIRLGCWERDTTDTRGPDVLSQLQAHPSVRKLIITGCLKPDVAMPFPLIKHVLPNLTHVDLTSTHWWNLTSLFTHLPRLLSLKLSLSGDGNLRGLQYLLSGIHPDVLELAKDFDILNAVGFAVVEAVASRMGYSKVGMANLKDLQVLDISECPEECHEVFLSKLTFGTVFLKMRSLKEIRIGGGELPKACGPFVEALRTNGIHVRVYKAKQ